MFTDICVIFLEEDVAVTNQAEEDRIVKETKISMDALAVAMVEEEIEYYLNGSKPEILVEGVPTANQADNDGMVEDATEVLVDVSAVANQKGEWLRRKPSTADDRKFKFLVDFLAVANQADKDGMVNKVFPWGFLLLAVSSPRYL